MNSKTLTVLILASVILGACATPTPYQGGYTAVQAQDVPGAQATYQAAQQVG